MENEPAIVSKSEVKAPVAADPVTVPGEIWCGYKASGTNHVFLWIGYVFSDYSQL